MAETNTRRTVEEFPGMITKAAQLETQEVTEAELRAINKYALTPVPDSMKQCCNYYK